jgi:chromosome segregation ATPase
MPPSSDSELLHQRLSELRTALDASHRECSNLESQVEGLTQSLQSKHEESTRLQLDLSKALTSLEFIQASWTVSS